MILVVGYIYKILADSHIYNIINGYIYNIIAAWYKYNILAVPYTGCWIQILAVGYVYNALDAGYTYLLRCASTRYSLLGTRTT